MDESGKPFLELLERVRLGDEAATETLWNDYYQSLVRLAAKRMPTNLRRTADEEDIAIATFQSFIAGVRRDQFPDLHGPENLWGLLITLTSRKVNAHLRHHTRQKRGSGNIRGESVFVDPHDRGREAGIGNVASEASSPDVRAELAEACEMLLEQLGDDQLRQIAVMRMDGFLVDEIAERLQLSKRAVERRLQLIRRMWTEAKEDEAKEDEADADERM